MGNVGIPFKRPVGGRGGGASHEEVALLVQSQVVRAGEAALAVGALERLDACVFAEVSRQFVGTSELPRAAFPHALVRFLTWKTEETGEQVNTFDCLRMAIKRLFTYNTQR